MIPQERVHAVRVLIDGMTFDELRHARNMMEVEIYKRSKQQQEEKK